MSHSDAMLNAMERSLDDRLAANGPLRLGDTPDIPLAFNVPLASEAPAANGALLFRLHGLQLHGAGSTRLNRDRSTRVAGRLTAWLDFGALTLEGRYDLLGKPMAIVDMDTGGTLLDRAPSDALPAGAPAITPLDPAQQSAMLDQAQQERTRLMDHPNGVHLLTTFNEHNETYNTVFATSAAARQAWAAEGATKAMAQHTHTALDTPNRAHMAVNPPTSQATFGPHGQNYNENAFNRQLAMAVNTVGTDPNFDPFDPNAKLDPESKFVKAALAALTFGNAVGQTGNSKSSTHPMTGEAVHDAVRAGRPPATATIDELSNVVAQGVQPGGAFAAVARERKWRVLDEADRTLVRRSLHAVALERAESRTVVASSLWSGACRGRIAGASARITFPDSVGSGVQEVAIELPAFEIEIDDAGWSGAAGAAARERLAEAFFLLSLLRERVERALSGLAEAVAERGCEARARS